ncbi:MAG: hypothetical protein LBU88_04860, partial [Treponema sp.]|nr:hypothetical protein [Treponema sp.]
MFKKVIFLFVTLLLVTGLLYAGGGRDKNESRTAQDPTNFTDSFDLSERKPGKWNFYIEATDSAG